MPTRSDSTPVRWVSSLGGPLIVLPDAALARWRGAEGADPDSPPEEWGDYGRAVDAGGGLATLPVGGAEALVLGEAEPTTYLPEQRLLAQWGGAGSDLDDEALAEIPAAMADAAWRQELTWTVSEGPATLFDPVFPGDATDEHLPVDVPAGAHPLSVAEVRLSHGPAVTLVRVGSPPASTGPD